jgi:hypothetical protein
MSLNTEARKNYITSQYVTLRYVTYHYITLRYVTLRYITLHYITLHYMPSSQEDQRFKVQKGTRNTLAATFDG